MARTGDVSKPTAELKAGGWSRRNFSTSIVFPALVGALTADIRTARRDVRRRGARVQSQSTVPCGWRECARDLAHRESRRSRARHAMDRSSVPELHIVVRAGWFGRIDPCNLTVRIVRGRLGSL